MTTSQSTTFSPSSRSTTRSTPCVLGCCGPMLITSSFVSNIAPRTVSTVKAQLSTFKNQRSLTLSTVKAQLSTLKNQRTLNCQTLTFQVSKSTLFLEISVES